MIAGAYAARMTRLRLRPAFVVTFSVASAACAKEVPVERGHNPPGLPDRDVPTAETGAASASVARTAPTTSTVAARDHSVARNPSAGGSQVRRASNGSCFVYKPFGPLKPGELRPPGTEPPRDPVACPAGFADDPAYKDCVDGVVLATADGGDCVCAVGGNPPPLPRPVVCPK